MMESYVYFMQNDNDGSIKIGFSRQLHERIKASELHEQFAGHRIQGEWFKPHDDILKFIETYANPSLPQLRAAYKPVRYVELPSIDDLVEASYEAITDVGRIAREKLDDFRWYIGDLARIVGKKYGEKLIDDFAVQIGISKSSAQKYRRVASFYEKSTRVHFADTNIFWTHYRIAIAAGTVTEAMLWLERASSEGWSCDQLAAQMSKSGLVRDYLLKETVLDPLVIDMLRELQGDVYLSVWREKQVERI